MADTFGEQLSFCEPYWYQGHPSPFYHDGHKRYRALVRKFVEEELMPNADKWIQEGYPVSLNKRAFDAGITGIIYPKKYGGYMPDDFDAFYELIMLDEINRIGGGNILFQHQINSMALPPIINGGSEELKRRVVIPTIKGDKNCCLAISEPYAGSDVAGIRCTAKKEGDHYIVNGQKKWITGGMTADFFTTLVRTGGEGHGGLSVLLIDRHTPGVQVRKMETQFDNAHSTTMVTLNNVKVPATHLIGREGQGFKIITTNFNHERFVLAIGACRQARVCYEHAFKWALQRKTFGKRLVDHQIIRYKLSEMARQIENVHDTLERVAYAFSKGIPDNVMGQQCALLKVSSTRTLEVCAREASQIFGGSSIVKEGKGRVVERIYREVRAQAIPGGAEEILSDFAIRQAIAMHGSKARM